MSPARPSFWTCAECLRIWRATQDCPCGGIPLRPFVSPKRVSVPDETNTKPFRKDCFVILCHVKERCVRQNADCIPWPDTARREDYKRLQEAVKAVMTAAPERGEEEVEALLIRLQNMGWKLLKQPDAGRQTA